MLVYPFITLQALEIGLTFTDLGIIGIFQPILTLMGTALIGKKTCEVVSKVYFHNTHCRDGWRQVGYEASLSLDHAMHVCWYLVSLYTKIREGG